MNKNQKRMYWKTQSKNFERWERRIRSKADCLHRSGDSGCRLVLAILRIRWKV